MESPTKKRNFSISDENLERRYIVKVEKENPRYSHALYIFFEKKEDLLRVGDILVLNPEEGWRTISLRK